MTKIILALIIISLLIGGYVVFSTDNSFRSTIPDPRATISTGGVKEFEGTLLDFDESCEIDGQCIAYVDDYEIIVNEGDVEFRAPHGKSDVGKEDVGKDVKVKAKVILGKKLSIIGSEEYYVLEK